MKEEKKEERDRWTEGGRKEASKQGPDGSREGGKKDRWRQRGKEETSYEFVSR